MSYENAPATKMVATRCASCSRPLVDSESVNAGMGPDCRKRHGYNAAQYEADWAHVIATLQARPELRAEAEEASATDSALRLANIGATEILMRDLREPARGFANKLVHRIACDQEGPHVAALTDALRALGFAKLAERISERLAPIRVAVGEDGRLAVRAPYSEEAVGILRQVPGRTWDKGEKVNRYPYTSRAALYAALKRAYPGLLGVGPKGFFYL